MLVRLQVWLYLMQLSMTICEDAFEDVVDATDLKNNVLSLCSTATGSKEMNQLMVNLKNFHLHGWSDKECYELIDRILPDCKPEVVAQVLEGSNSYLVPFYQNKLLVKHVEMIKKSHLNQYVGLVSGSGSDEFDVRSVLAGVHDLDTLLVVLRNVRKTSPMIFDYCKSAIINPPNKKGAPKFLLDLGILCTQSSLVQGNLEQYLRSSENLSEFEVLCMVAVFNGTSRSCQDLWKVLLGKFGPHSAKIVISSGHLLGRVDERTALKFKLAALQFIESNEFNQPFSQLLSLLLMSCRSFSRAEIISELLMLASDSDDSKYIKYLNVLLEVPSDSVNLGLNDFKTVLDFVEFVPQSMILEFYTVMVKIALKMGGTSPVMNDLCLIVRKQLASANEHVCLNGVAGAVALAISTVPKAQEVFDFEFASCSQSASKSNNELVVDLALTKEFLTMAYTASLRFPSTARFFYDTLIRAVEEEAVSHELMELLNERLAEDFQHKFVSDCEADVPEDGEIKFNLMDDTELVVIRIYPVITQLAHATALVHIPQHLRLLGALEKKMNGGNLENIDAILKFPFVLPSCTVDTQLCFLSHLTAYNLIREMINTFHDQSDTTMKENSRKRLLHMAEIEGELLDLMRKASSFSGLQQTPFGVLVCPLSVQVMQKSAKLTTSSSLGILVKANAYCSDKTGGNNESRQLVKVKSETDLFRLSLPLHVKVLQWANFGLEADGKGKDDDSITPDEMLALLHEMKMQLKAKHGNKVLVIEAIESATETFLTYQTDLDEESDLVCSFPKLVMEIATELKESNSLSPRFSKQIQRYLGNGSSDAESLNNLRLRMLLVQSSDQEQDVLTGIIGLLDDSEDQGTILELVLNAKGFSSDLRPLYSAISKQAAKTNKSGPLLKSLLAVLMVEIERSRSLERDLWSMEQLENLAQSAKNSFNSECADILLKSSLGAIDLVISKVMPRLEVALLEHKDDVLMVLKKFQQFTRTIQTICNHIKASKDKALLKRVPSLKKSLEASLVRVKQMLQANNCHGAFWVGNLKHKGLDGKEVESQIPLKRNEPADDNEEDDEEEILSADEDDEPVVSDSDTAEDPTLALSI